MSATPPSKTAKRDEPELQLFEDASTDRMAQMLLVMAAEMHVLRDRVKCMEFVLAEHGILGANQIDQFTPTPKVLQHERDAFVAHLFEVMDGRAKSTSGRGNPLVPPTPGHGA